MRPIKALVTGGAGFIGSHLVRLLVKEGVQVRVLVRDLRSLKTLEGVEIDPVLGDLRDPEFLRKLCQGCDTLFHTAGLYQFWSADPKEFYASNVEGTRNILTAAMQAGVGKVVYTSTVGTIRYPKDPYFPSDESCFPTDHDLHNDYKRSKFQAEQIALDFANRGLPVVIVNPSTPFGAYDVKPTPTGKIIVDFLRGKIPAFLNTGLNVIDVEDVAWGHWFAAQKGRIGERYILGNLNISLQEIYQLLARLTGRRAPLFRIPYSIAWGVGAVSETMAKLFHTPPQVPLGAVRMAKYFMYFNVDKARAELGLPQSPIEPAFQKAISWFETNGYLR